MSRFVYQGVLHDGNGKRLASGNIAVLLAGTSTPATIYAASTGGVSVASVTSGSDGSWSFYIDESEYAGTQRFDVVMSKSGYSSVTLSNIEVLPAASHVGLTVKDATTNSKQLTVDISGATAAKTVTLTSNHTDDRVVTLPDATDTLVGRATTDTLTNKTITSCTINNDVTGDLTGDVAGALAPTVMTASAWPSFSVDLGANQSNITSTDKILFDTEEFDTNSDFAASRFTPTVAGKYLLTTSCTWLSTTAGDDLRLVLYKNGAEYVKVYDLVYSTSMTQSITHVVDANGSSDYFEIYALNTDRNTSAILGGSRFSGCRVG